MGQGHADLLNPLPMQRRKACANRRVRRWQDLHECSLNVTVLPETSSGEHKMKLLSLPARLIVVAQLSATATVICSHITGPRT